MRLPSSDKPKQTKAQYAKGKMPDTKCHIVWCGFHFHEMYRRDKALLIKSRPVLPRAGGRGDWAVAANGYEFLSGGDERVPELDSGDIT